MRIIRSVQYNKSMFLSDLAVNRHAGYVSIIDKKKKRFAEQKYAAKSLSKFLNAAVGEKILYYIFKLANSKFFTQWG